MSKYSGRRFLRTKDFEEWHFYKNGYPHVDTVLIFFNNKKTHMYLITTHKNINKEHSYISLIVNLVHDFSEDFDFKIEKIDTDCINNSEVITDVVYNTAQKIISKINKKVNL